MAVLPQPDSNSTLCHKTELWSGLNGAIYSVCVCGHACMCESEAQDVLYLGTITMSDGSQGNTKPWDLGHLQLSGQSLISLYGCSVLSALSAFLFFVSVFLFSLITPSYPPLSLHQLSLFPPLALSRGPSLNPRERGRSLGWRGRAGNPCSDPGQFNYPVFFRCTTRVPISQPTPLMRPGLASLTFNDLPIDALGP